MQFFPLVTTAALRPTRLDEVTLHIASDTGQFSIGYTFAGTTTWVGIGTSVGLANAITTYLGGTIVVPTGKAISFTATNTEASVYEIQASGLAVLLTGAIGTRFEFWALASVVAPNTTFTPQSGTISSSETGFAQATAVVTPRAYSRCVARGLDGNWTMSGM